MLAVLGSVSPCIMHTTYHVFMERVELSYSHPLFRSGPSPQQPPSNYSESLGCPVMPASGRGVMHITSTQRTVGKEAIKSSVNDLQPATLHSGVVQKEQSIKAYYI